MRNAISYESLQEYVLENGLTDNDTIILHPDDYDAVATEYVVENSLVMYHPVEVLGTRVIEDISGELKKNNIYVLPLAAS